MPANKLKQLTYKSDIRTLLGLGLTPETIARTLKQKHNLSRASTYNYLRDIRQADSALAESKDRKYIHSDISICRERLLHVYRQAVAENPRPADKRLCSCIINEVSTRYSSNASKA